MSKGEAETVIGKPLFESLRQTSGEVECWYVKDSERKMEMHESPWGMGGIVVKYKDGKIIDKKYNFQWVKREHRELYERGSAGERQ